MIAIGRIGGAKGVDGGVKVSSYSGEYEHFIGLVDVDLVPGTEDGFLEPSREHSPARGSAAKRGAKANPAEGIAGADGVVVFGRGKSAPASKGSGASRPAVRSDPPVQALKVRIVDMEAGPGNLVLHFKGYDSPESARSLSGMDIMVPVDKGAALRPGEWYVRDLVGLKLVLAGKTVATVSGVFDGAADPCLEASLPGGRVALIPFRNEFVGNVDLEAGTVILLAPWLLEE